MYNETFKKKYHYFYPLFGDGLGLDSIDALELGIAIKKKYGVQLSEDSAENQKHFASVSSLARFIEQSQPQVLGT